MGKSIKKQIEGVNDLVLITLSNKEIDAINGVEFGLLYKAGWSVLVLPFGEENHKWSSEITSKALRAVAFKGDQVEFGWVSPNVLAGGSIYESIPTNAEWALSADEQWYCAKGTGERIHFGVSVSSKSMIDITAGETSIPCLFISLGQVKEGFVGRVLPRTDDAQKKLRGKKTPIFTRRPNKDVSMWDSKKAWTGTVRRATAADFDTAGVEVPAALNGLLA